jgi:hypothetical protein
MALSDLRHELDRDALVQGAATGVLVVGPLAGLSVLLIDEGDAEGSGGTSAVFYLAILGGFVLVGWLAARAAPQVPLSHGAVAALIAYVVVQATILLIASVAGQDTDPSPVGIAFGALLATSAGTIGALIAQRRKRTRS